MRADKAATIQSIIKYVADKAATTQYTMMYAADKAAPVQANVPNKPCPDHYPKHIYTTHIMSTDL